MAGSLRRCRAKTRVLMCSNCAFLSGCWLPSRVFRFDCKLYPNCFRSRPTVEGLTFNFCRRNSAERFPVLIHVYRSGFVGSPRVAGLTSCSSAVINCGCLSWLRFRPPPGRRCRSASSCDEECSSRIPVRMVRSEIPVASATAAMPPRPSERASAAAQRRRPRSSRSATKAMYFVRIQ